MVENTRENILKHETPEYIASRPDWVVGKIPDLSDYRKLSVDSFEEAFKLARLGQEMASMAIPTFKGQPLKLYFTQALILGAALIDRAHAEALGLDFEKYRSVLMTTISRYGKSFLNAIALIVMAGAAGKECQIGAATKDKAGVIQNKVVQLLPNSVQSIQDGLIVTSDDDEAVNKKIARMSTQVSKEALMWRNGGSIKSFSTNEGNKSGDVQAAGAIGIGGEFVVMDEVQLLSPVGFRTASRFMVENPDTKRFMVGNPMINGHFRDVYDDPSTFVVHSNDVTAIIEGRATRESFALTGMPTYSNEYRYYIMTEFPDESTGTRFFSTMPQVWDKGALGEPVSKIYYMGIDSAYKGADGIVVSVMSLNMNTEGKRWCAIEHQFDAKRRFTEWTEATTLDICLDILKVWDKYNCVAGCIDIGFGIHLYEKMKELYPNIALEPINFAGKPTEWRVENEYNAKYAVNKRAEMHLDLKDLCENHLLYIAPDTYDEAVREMREVGNSPEASKVKIEAKKNIKIRIGRSPDFLDSACLAVHAMILSGTISGGGTNEDMLVEFIN